MSIMQRADDFFQQLPNTNVPAAVITKKNGTSSKPTDCWTGCLTKRKKYTTIEKCGGNQWVCKPTFL
jgi:hypothetical protein